MQAQEITPLRFAKSAWHLALVAGLGIAAARAQAQGGAQLFPQPFVVEHRIIQVDADGSTFEGAPVTDYYGGVWIVSVRPDGSRTVVDFARREITEVRPGQGTYSVLSFDRLAELTQRLRRAESGAPALPQRHAAPREGGGGATPRVEELAPGTHGRFAAGRPLGAVAGRQGVRAFHAVLDGETAGAAPGAPLEVEVWLDGRVRLSEKARKTLASFEGEVLDGSGGHGPRGLPRLMAAARESADGAFPVRTARALRAREDGTAVGALVDEADRLEVLAQFPVELIEVSDGLRRVPHPLEVMVAWAEQEAELTSRSAGKR